jgi:prevent-host-death family protein
VARSIAQRELRNDNARVIDAVVAGETFIVTRNGVPVAELRPIRTERRRFVSRADLQALAASGPPLDGADFRAALDRYIDPSL